MFVFPRRLDQLSRFHCWVDLALLFKKGVGREIAVLEVADNVFSNVQHSRNPVLILLRTTHCRWPLPKHHSASRTFSWRLHLCSLEKNATLLQLCGARWRKLRSRSSHVTKFLRDLLASVAPKKNESKQMDQIFKSSSTKFAHLVAKARWSVRRKGDWKEIAKLKAKYSIAILDLQLPACAADVSFVTTLFAGVDLQRSDGRGVSQLPICADTHFFLLNECSLSQNECLWPLQTNFYRMFGRFVSALVSRHSRSMWFL